MPNTKKYKIKHYSNRMFEIVPLVVTRVQYPYVYFRDNNGYENSTQFDSVPIDWFNVSNFYELKRNNLHIAFLSKVMSAHHTLDDVEAACNTIDDQFKLSSNEYTELFKTFKKFLKVK